VLPQSAQKEKLFEELQEIPENMAGASIAAVFQPFAMASDLQV